MSPSMCPRCGCRVPQRPHTAEPVKADVERPKRSRLFRLCRFLWRVATLLSLAHKVFRVGRHVLLLATEGHGGTLGIALMRTTARIQFLAHRLFGYKKSRVVEHMLDKNLSLALNTLEVAKRVSQQQAHVPSTWLQRMQHVVPPSALAGAVDAAILVQHWRQVSLKWSRIYASVLRTLRFLLNLLQAMF
ncbi:MAG: hypothetical protein MHM6MM_002011 [Cercozoa sp. M6MM]